MILNVIEFPNELLNSPCLYLEESELTPNLIKIMDDMVETMYAMYGVGLAAPQVGLLKRFFVCHNGRNGNYKLENKQDPMYFINPEIIEVSENMKKLPEGCLSIPGVYELVERPAVVKVRYLDRDFKQQEEEFTDLLGVCVQHEIDHLYGVNFIDRISKIKRTMHMQKYFKRK